jgi:hypothetical protein
MRYVKIRPVHKDKCQEMTAHQAETQIFADGSLFIVFYAVKIFIHCGDKLILCSYLKTFSISNVTARQIILTALNTIPRISSTLFLF